ncbi:MAG: TetR/AcrR family transcriptional regulator [Myxococcota bacterium]
MDRRERREDKRRRIIDAAVQIFAAKGFFGSRVSEIADAAGVADGTIYLYFKSKDEILISLFEERMTEINRRFAAILAECPEPEERLRRYLTEHLRLVAEQPKLMQVLTVELRQSVRFIREYRPKGFAKYLALLGSILEDGKASGAFRPDMDTGLFRRALFGAIDEISLEWVLRAGSSPMPDPERVGDQIARFVLRGLRPDRRDESGPGALNPSP